MQASADHRADELEADIAWLKAAGADGHVAYIHPDHAGSATTVRKPGLCPTAVVEDGEIRWQNE
ncbi:MAG TPA: hypothetical protein VIG75_10815 [Citricoccus sp.]